MNQPEPPKPDQAIESIEPHPDAARRGDIDAAVLLGDYIYESDLSPGLEFASRVLGRNWEPDRATGERSIKTIQQSVEQFDLSLV